MPDLISGNITFAGLGSGTDFDSLIEGLVSIEQRRVTTLEDQLLVYEARQEAQNELKAQLMACRSTLAGMDSTKEFLIKSANVSVENVLSATADADAEEGSYTVEVNQLAQNDIWYSDSFPVADSDTTSVVGALGGTLSFDYAGTAGYSVTLAANTTLDGIANAINNDINNPGIRASVIKVADNDYRLQVRGLDLGADNQVENLAFGGDMLFGGSFTETQDAQNAQFRVDGFPTASWMERSSNSVADVVPGLSLLLKEAGTTSITVAADTGAIQENVQSFVDAINETRIIFQALTETSEEEGSSVFSSNYTVVNMDRRLKNITASRCLGTDPTMDYSALSTIGISTDVTPGSETYGQLVLDTAELAAALADDPDTVAKLFGADYEGNSNSADFIFHSALGDITKAGQYDVSYDVVGGNVVNATIGGEAATWDAATKTLTASSGDATGLAISITNLTDGAGYTGTVGVQLGKAGELIDELDAMTTDVGNPFTIMEDSTWDSILMLQERIISEQIRIDNYEDSLKRRFSALDATLTTYNGIQATLTSQLEQFSSSS